MFESLNIYQQWTLQAGFTVYTVYIEPQSLQFTRHSKWSMLYLVKQELGLVFRNYSSISRSMHTFVNSDPVVGRYMVAARDIEAGEVIFNDEPACIGESRVRR